MMMKTGNKIIFVTVGNGKFDPLIKQIDKLVGMKVIKEKIIAQIGLGKYEPKFIQWFRFENSLEKYYQQADLVISHGGPGIVFEVLRRGQKLIALPNRDRTDPNHQVEYLRAMAKETNALIYCDTVGELAECLDKAKTHHFEKYQTPSCRMGEVIKKFLK